MQGLDVALATLLESGEEAIASVPVFFLDWFFQRQGSHLMGVPTFPEEGYTIDWARFERAITPRTRVIVAITPANPTGHVLTSTDVQALAEIAERHNLMVVSDESYDRLVYDGEPHLSPAANPVLAERTVVIRSFTKSFAMAGWRVGYLVGPAPTINACLKIIEWMALYGSYVPQAAAAAALTGPQHWLSDVADEFQQRRDQLLEVFDELAIPVVSPRGGPFLFPDVSGRAAGADPGDWLLREFGIPAVDGALLGGPGRVRIAFGADDAIFSELTHRLRAAFSVRAPVRP
jgi:aspartate/methionine/tyrosine aminotransferase